MQITKSLPVFNNKQLFRFVWETITLLFLSNISACTCKQYAKPSAANTSMNMTIAERFLVGEEKKIKVTFEIGGDANDLVN